MEFCNGGDLHDAGEKYACIEGFEYDRLLLTLTHQAGPELQSNTTRYDTRQPTHHHA